MEGGNDSLKTEDVWRWNLRGLDRIKVEVFRQSLLPGYQFRVEVFESGTQLDSALVKGSFGIDTTKYVAHDDRQVTQGRKGCHTVGWATTVFLIFHRVGKGLPVLQLLVRI